MWIARDKDAKRCCLFVNKPKRWNTFWSDGKSDNQLILDSMIFSELTWEDDPIEVKLVEVNPLYKKVCPHCGKKVKYHQSDIKYDRCCQPGSPYPDDEYEYIFCPECKKYIELFCY